MYLSTLKNNHKRLIIKLLKIEQATWKVFGYNISFVIITIISNACFYPKKGFRQS